MQKHYLLIALAAILSLTSCSKYATEMNEGIVVKLMPIGEISDVYYSDFTKADGDDYYLIMNVFVWNSANAQYSEFASGVFNNLSNVSIELTKGNKYKVVSSYVPSFVDRYGWQGVSLNEFQYGNAKRELYTSYYASGLSAYTRHPLFERYYCESEFIVTDVSTITLNMKRCSSKLSVSVENLTVGSIITTIRFSNSNDAAEFNKEFSIELEAGISTSKELVFSLMDATICWNDDSYVETYPVDFYYKNGDHIEKIETKDISFKRNQASNVILSINNGESNNGRALSTVFDSEYKQGQTYPISVTL